MLEVPALKEPVRLPINLSHLKMTVILSIFMSIRANLGKTFTVKLQGKNGTRENNKGKNGTGRNGSG